MIPQSQVPGCCSERLKDALHFALAKEAPSLADLEADYATALSHCATAAAGHTELQAVD
jgi:hypothetical protein